MKLVSKMNCLLILMVAGFGVISYVWAKNYGEQKDDSQTVRDQAILNYKIINAPPDASKSPSEWLVYFGPTEEEAKNSKVAEKKRKYIQAHSPLGTIPKKRVERRVNWLSLTPMEWKTSNTTTDEDATTRSKLNYGY